VRNIEPLSESLPQAPELYYPPLHIINYKFSAKDRGTLKSTGPAATATFATIVNLALYHTKSQTPSMLDEIFMQLQQNIGKLFHLKETLLHNSSFHLTCKSIFSFNFHVAFDELGRQANGLHPKW